MVSTLSMLGSLATFSAMVFAIPLDRNAPSGVFVRGAADEGIATPGKSQMDLCVWHDPNDCGTLEDSCKFDFDFGDNDARIRIDGQIASIGTFMMRSDKYEKMGPNVILRAAKDPNNPLVAVPKLPQMLDDGSIGDFKAENGTCYKMSDIVQGYDIGEVYGLEYWQVEDDADM